MASVLSVTASATGLFDLTVRTCRTVFSYASSVNDASKAIANFKVELENVRQALFQVEVLEHRVQGPLPASLIGELAPETLKCCRDDLETIERKLKEGESQSKLKWPFLEDEMVAMAERLHRYCDTFQLIIALDASQASVTVLNEVKAGNEHQRLQQARASTKLEELSALQSESKIGIDSLLSRAAEIKASSSKRQNDQDIADVASDLKIIDFSQKHLDIASKRCADTGNWFLDDDDLKAWMFEPESQRLLFCSGESAVGKTILMSLVIDTLRCRTGQHNIGIAFAYYDLQERFNGKDTKDYTFYNVAYSLIAQLAEQAAWNGYELPSEVWNLCEQKRKKTFLPNNSALIYTLLSFVQLFETVYIIIDALDECPDYPQVLAAIELLSRKSHFKIVVACRAHHSAIHDAMSTAVRITITAQKEDIETYVKGVIRKNLEIFMLIDKDEKLQEEIVSKVWDKTQVLQMNEIGDALSKAGIKRALNSLPRSLNDYFDLALSRVQTQAEDKINMAMKTFAWVFHAKRTLLARELSQALAVDINGRDWDEDEMVDAQKLVRICCGLITIEKDSDKVRFVHYTLHQYFENRKQPIIPEAESVITITCLKYLSFKAIGDYIEVEKPVYVDSKGPEFHGFLKEMGQDPQNVMSAISGLGMPMSQVLLVKAESAKRCRYEFTYYAAKFWGYHAQGEPEETLLPDIKIYLLDPRRLQQWFEVTMHPYYNGTYNEMFHGIYASGLTCEPLIAATFFGLEKVARSLLQRGCNVQARNDIGYTPLHIAAGKGYEDMVSLLLSYNADLQAPVTPSTVNTGAAVDLNHTPIHAAARNPNGRTLFLLVRAAKIRHPELQHTLNILPTAIFHGSVAAIKVLIENDFGLQNKNDAMLATTKSGDWKILEMLLNQGFPASAVDSEGNTILHIALSQPKRATSYIAGIERFIDILIHHGVNVKAKNKYGNTPLHMLTDVNLLSILVRHGADMETQNGSGRTVLLETVSNHRYDIFGKLLRKGAIFKTMDRMLRTPLHIVFDVSYAWFYKPHESPYFDFNEFFDQYRSIASSIMDISEAFNSKDEAENTPLLIASMNAFQIPFELLTRRVEVHHGYDDLRLGKPLSLRFEDFSLDIIGRLLRCGADVHSANNDGYTGLHLISQLRESAAFGCSQKMLKPSTEVANLIIRGGADINAQDHNGQTPLHQSMSEAYVTPLSMLPTASEEFTRFLLLNGSDATARDHDGRTALHVLASLRSKARYSDTLCSLAKVLIEAGTPVNARDGQGRTLLHLAVTLKLELTHLNSERALLSPDFVSLLLEAGAKPSELDPEGQTPLHILAKTYKHFHCISEKDDLNSISCGKKGELTEDVLKYSIKGLSPNITKIKYALATFGRTVKVLLDAGADINAQTTDGQTPLHVAVRFNDDSWLVSILLVLGANPNASNSDGNTPLHAVMQDWETVNAMTANKVASLLLLSGADLNVSNSKGQTPLHIALGRQSYFHVIPRFRFVGSVLPKPTWLIASGADPRKKNIQGKTAWDVMAPNKTICHHRSLPDLKKIAPFQEMPLEPRTRRRASLMEPILARDWMLNTSTF